MSGFDLYFVFWIPLMILGVGLLPINYIFLKRLREKHPAAWSALGEPTMFFNSSMKNQRAVRQFIRSKEHLELHDPVLNRLARVAQWGGRVSLALFVACVIVFAFIFGKP